MTQDNQRKYGHEQENQRPQQQIQTPADNTGAQTETYRRSQHEDFDQ
jgi:hypothetical protein